MSVDQPLSEPERRGLLAGLDATLNLDGLTLSYVAIRRVADGSNRWAIFADGRNPDGRLATHRTLVEDDGSLSGPHRLDSD